jgi:hypothetical protein
MMVLMGRDHVIEQLENGRWSFIKYATSVLKARLPKQYMLIEGALGRGFSNGLHHELSRLREPFFSRPAHVSQAQKLRQKYSRKATVRQQKCDK